MSPKEVVIADLNRYVLKDIVKAHKFPALDTVIDPQIHLTHYGRVTVLAYLFNKHFADKAYKLAVGEVLVDFKSTYLLVDIEVIEEILDIVKNPRVARDFYASTLIALESMDKDNIYYGQIANVWEQLNTQCHKKKSRKLLT